MIEYPPLRTDPTTLAEDFEPPEPWRSFGLRMRGQARHIRQHRTVDHLTDAELLWVGRVLAAELQRRERRRRP